MSTRTNLARLLVTGGLILGVAAVPAGADPLKDGTFSIECDNGQTYEVSTNGNGDFTPAHDVNSTSTLVPLSFGPFHGVVTDSAGNVVETIDEPGGTKGQSGKNAKNTVNCSFTFSGSEDGLNFTGTGTVTGYITPRGK